MNVYTFKYGVIRWWHWRLLRGRFAWYLHGSCRHPIAMSQAAGMVLTRIQSRQNFLITFYINCFIISSFCFSFSAHLTENNRNPGRNHWGGQGVRTPPTFAKTPPTFWTTFSWGGPCAVFFMYFHIFCNVITTQWIHPTRVSHLAPNSCCRRDNKCNTTSALRTKRCVSFSGFIVFYQRFKQ